MKEKLEKLLKEGEAKITGSLSESELQEVKAHLLGKQGVFTEVMKEMPKLDPALRPEIGKKVNQIKTRFNELIDSKRSGYYAA